MKKINYLTNITNEELTDFNGGSIIEETIHRISEIMKDYFGSKK